MPYCIYLRKSRADIELEAYGEGETLARHEKALLDLAERRHLPISKIYKEIVSGETIAARPVVQQLLAEVEKGLWDGVLVMEVERLGRGDTIDQGIIAQTFKFTDTLIITPNKTYNPCNEFDEEYFEFGLFMSRREYKTINRRLQRGRLASVKEGKWVGSVSPYGYERVKLPNAKGYTLKPLPQEAEIVKLIFDYYVNGKYDETGIHKQLGFTLIARELNKMKIPTRSDKPWSLSTVKSIIQNPVYIGMVRWGFRPQIKAITDGKILKSRPVKVDYPICKGLHQPLVELQIWEQAQKILKSRSNKPIPKSKSLQNPLGGLIYCSCCGKLMQRKPSNKKNISPSLICTTVGCKNVSSSLDIVEKKVQEFLNAWLHGYKIPNTSKQMPPPFTAEIEKQRTLIKHLRQTADNLAKQSDRLHDFLEQGIYSPDTFLTRSKILKEKLQTTQTDLHIAQKQLELLESQNQKADCTIPEIKKPAEIYTRLNLAQDKNLMLKTLIEKIVYYRAKGGKYTDSNNFHLVIYPKIPPR